MHDFSQQRIFLFVEKNKQFFLKNTKTTVTKKKKKSLSHRMGTLEGGASTKSLNNFRKRVFRNGTNTQTDAHRNL